LSAPVSFLECSPGEVIHHAARQPPPQLLIGMRRPPPALIHGSSSVTPSSMVPHRRSSKALRRRSGMELRVPSTTTASKPHPHRGEAPIWIRQRQTRIWADSRPRWSDLDLHRRLTTPPPSLRGRWQPPFSTPRSGPGGLGSGLMSFFIFKN
jgi:hypothetical protein